MIPADGLAEGVKILVADAAYTRASDELKEMMYLPLKLPENGDNPQVFFFSSFQSLHI